ncbi:MAG: amidohydrolase family protein [Gemmatimonadaceae bacterium]
MPPPAAGSRVRYHARWVVPVATPPVERGTVVVDDDRIAWVGPTAQAPAGGRDEDLGESILTPGLVNAHTHLDLTVMRGFLEDLPFFDWVRALTRARNDVLTESDLRDSAMLGIAEGLLAGVTTFGDTAASAGPFDAMRSMGVRGIAYREVFGPDPAECGVSMEGLKANVAAMRAAATPLVRVGVSPHAPYSVSDALFAAVADYAARESLPVAVHVAESAEERALVEQGRGRFADFLRSRGIAVAPRAATPMALLGAAGLMRAGTLLIHCVHASADDIHAVSHGGCGVAHCPASNAKLGHGIAPLAEFIAAGARVGLGSDSMASNNQMDLLGEARLAVLQQRSRPGRGAALSARAALRLATLGGAEALRLDADIGALAVGRQADLAVFAIDATHGPVIDPVTALVFAPRLARAHRVVVAGIERVRDGAVVGLEPSLATWVANAFDRLLQWRSSRPER